MAELRHLLAPEQAQELWATKDGLALLSEDPIQMHKGKFVKYLQAKAEALAEDYMALGMSHDEALAKTRADLTAITADWKQEARRRHRQ